jgi:ribosomal protein S18 acetylase RimI-like enzyme
MTDDRFRRAVALEHDVMRRTSTRVEGFAWGTVYLNQTMPHRYSSNLLWVALGERPRSATALAREAELVLGGIGLEHRKVNVDGEGGRALAPGFFELGWNVHRLLVMTQERASERTSSVPVERVAFDVVRPVAETIARRAELTQDETVLGELVGYKSVAERDAGARFFVGRIGGALAGVCELYVGDGVAQIEDVNTLEEYRGRGVATAMVLAATETARAEDADQVFIVADDDDWPKHLYARLGFDVAGPAWEFVRAAA